MGWGRRQILEFENWGERWLENKKQYRKKMGNVLQGNKVLCFSDSFQTFGIFPGTGKSLGLYRKKDRIGKKFGKISKFIWLYRRGKFICFTGWGGSYPCGCFKANLDGG